MEITESNQIIENAITSDTEENKISKEKLRLLHKIPTFRPIIQTFVVISTYLILAAIGFWLNNWAVWLLVWFGQGFLFCCFLSAMHDCSHSSLYKSKCANRNAGTFWALAIFINFSLYKYGHLLHHRQTKVKGYIKENIQPWQSFTNIWIYLANLTNFYPLAVWKIWWMVTKGLYPDFVKTPMQRKLVLRDNWILLGWLVLMGGLTVILPGIMFCGYWIPLIFFAPTLAFIFSITEHYGCEFDLNHNEWNDTRTIISNPIIRFYYWNNNYHVEHHLYPSMPGCNYPKIHELIKYRIQYLEKSYLMFHVKVIRGLISAKSQ